MKTSKVVPDITPFQALVASESAQEPGQELSAEGSSKWNACITRLSIKMVEVFIFRVWPLFTAPPCP
jgi:hypothetical protein